MTAEQVVAVFGQDEEPLVRDSLVTSSGVVISDPVLVERRSKEKAAEIIEDIVTLSTAPSKDDETEEDDEAEEVKTPKSKSKKGKKDYSEKPAKAKKMKAVNVDPVMGPRVDPPKAPVDADGKPLPEGNIITESGERIPKHQSSEALVQQQLEAAQRLAFRIKQTEEEWFAKSKHGMKFDQNFINLAAQNNKYKLTGKIRGSLQHAIKSKINFVSTDFI